MIFGRFFLLISVLSLGPVRHVSAHSELPQLPATLQCGPLLQNGAVLPPWPSAKQRRILTAPHSSLQSLSVSLGFTPLVQHEIHTHNQVLALLYPNSDLQFAQIRFYTHAASIEVDGLYVAPSMKGLGISRFLFTQMLAENPKLRSIQTSLVKDNAEVFRAAYEKLEDTLPFKNAYELCSEAVRATPAYKVRRANGFSHIIECSPGKIDEKTGQYRQYPSFKVEKT